MRYPVVLQREENGRYSVWVPDLPGCASMGDTRDEALANIREAAALYLESLREDRLPVPAGVSEIEVVEIEAA
jgi:predicted RNase H-like HicB family nuclease